MGGSHPPRDAASDPTGQRVGMIAAALAVALAFVSIGEHRAHTAAILHLSLANRQWARYEVANLKDINRGFGEDLLTGLNGNQSSAERMRADYARQKKEYEQETSQSRETAEHATSLSESDERRALHYDVGDGLLEIAVFLTSFYFVSRKNLFPVMGAAVGIAGLLVAFTGLPI